MTNRRVVTQRQLATAVAHIDPETGVMTTISGPVSPWPRDSLRLVGQESSDPDYKLSAKKKDGVLTSKRDIVKGLAQNTGRVLKRGWIAQEISTERFEKCKSCVITKENYEEHAQTLAMYNEREGFGYTLPAPDEYVLSKWDGCRICGCPMRTKTKVNFPPEKLCPLNRWDR